MYDLFRFFFVPLFGSVGRSSRIFRIWQLQWSKVKWSEVKITTKLFPVITSNILSNSFSSTITIIILYSRSRKEREIYWLISVAVQPYSQRFFFFLCSRYNANQNTNDYYKILYAGAGFNGQWKRLTFRILKRIFIWLSLFSTEFIWVNSSSSGVWVHSSRIYATISICASWSFFFYSSNKLDFF